MTEQEPGAAVVVSTGMASDIATVRSLGRRGIPVITVGFDSSEPLHHSKYATESKIVEKPADDYAQFVQSLLDIAVREDVQTMVPLNGFGIHSLMDYFSEFRNYLELPLVNPEQYEKVRDRKQLFDIALSLGISVPTALSIEEANNMDSPVVAKPRYTITQQDNSLQIPGVRILDEDVTESELVNEMGHTPLVQEYIDNGSEFGYFTVFDRGEPIAKFQHRRIRSTRYSGGASVYREATYVPEVEAMGERLLKKLNWHGPAMVEFRQDDATGELYLMEINPRFWGSLVLGIEAGVDFPYVYYQLSNGRRLETDHYDESVTTSYLRGEVQHLYSVVFESSKQHVRKPSVGETIINQLATIPSARQDMFDLDDPSPFLCDLVHTVKRYLTLKQEGESVLP